MSPRTHAPIFTDDSGARRVTVQWGGRVIALACVALWAALALTLGTQVSLPGLDRLPSLSDSVRRAIFPDTRLTGVPDVDRRQTELGRVSGVEVPRALPRPADDASEVRPTAEPRRSTPDAERTEAVITGSATPESATRSGRGKPDVTPGNVKSRKPAGTTAPPKVKPNAYANPRAKAAVSKAAGSKAAGSKGAGSKGVGSKGVGSKGRVRGQAQPDPNGKAAKIKAANPAPRISLSLRPGNDQPGQAPRGKPSADQD